MAFHAGIKDPGSGLFKFGQRWYNPTTGTWSQQDTLDAPLDPANANRYAYAGDDPINGQDPTGQDCRAARQVADAAIVLGGIATFAAPASGPAAPIVAAGGAGAVIGGGIGLFIVDSVC